jgi:hypothetical protein
MKLVGLAYGALSLLGVTPALGTLHPFIPSLKTEPKTTGRKLID